MSDLTAKEIRELLVTKYNFSQKDADAIKGITDLREELAEQETLVAAMNVEDVGDAVEVQVSDEPQALIPMNTTHPDWHDYVMGLFVDRELVECEGEKRPNINGLRRVAQICFGAMLKNEVRVVQAPLESNGYTSTVECTILFYNEATGRERLFSDAADVSPNNCEEKFARHASSTAATKAEARALRKLLQIRAISSEEASPVNLPEVRMGKITDTQIQALDTLGGRYDIDLIKVINSGEQHYTSIKQLSEETARKVLSMLNDESKRSELVKNHKGYDKQWKEIFA